MNDQFHADRSAQTPEGQRTKTRAEERIEALETSPTALAGQLEAVRQELAAAQQEAADNKAGWQRAAADFTNFKRRTEQERETTIGFANELLLSKLLNVVDDLDRALAALPDDLRGASWTEGIAAIDRKFRQLLESEGLTPIEALGKPFDPHEHEAVSHEETADAPDGAVIAELQRGYRLRDRVLRPSLVAVAKHPDPAHRG